MSTAAPAAPASNGSSGAQAPAAVAPKADVATGQQKPTAPQGAPVRGADGKFAKPGEAAPAETPKPKLRVKDLELDEDAAYSEIQRGRQASKHLTESQKRLEKAEALERAHQERRKLFREDPDAFFADAGFESEEERAKWASQYLYKKHIEPSQMSAEQRRIAELEQKLAGEEKRKAEEARQVEEAETQREQAAQAQTLRTELRSLIESGAMPKHPAAVKRVAEKIRAAEAKGLTISAPDAWASVQDEFRGDTGKYLESSSVEDLRRDMTPAAFKVLASKVIKWALDQRKPIAGLPQQRQSAPVPQQPTTKPMTQAELEEHLRSHRK